MYSLGEIAEYAKAHGFLSLVKAGVTGLIFCREEQILLCLSLEEPLAEIQPPRNITMRKATPADIPGLCEPLIKHNHLRSKKRICKWIAEGYPFFIATDDDKIVGFTCVSPEVSHVASNLQPKRNSGDVLGGYM